MTDLTTDTPTPHEWKISGDQLRTCSRCGLMQAIVCWNNDGPEWKSMNRLERTYPDGKPIDMWGDPEECDLALVRKIMQE